MVRRRLKWSLCSRTIDVGHRTLVMGILNVTPDSFFDGGVIKSRQEAIDRVLQMEAEGADIIDIGGESTRPGSTPVTPEEELRRVRPVIEGISGKVKVPLSIDTTKFEVARIAVECGVEIINDVSGLRRDDRLVDLVGQTGAGLIVMNMRGTPETMQTIPPSPDIFREIEDHFRWAIGRAVAGGVAHQQVVLDPGVGFGKTGEQNLALINHLGRFIHFNRPLLVGPSRKSFIGQVTGKHPGERLMGTAAAVVAAILRGAHIIRVHDVKEMSDVVRMADTIGNADDVGADG